MRRIKNSVKAIIVSLCLVVIFAGSIVGVVLSNKSKNGGNDNPGNTNPIESYELTEDQKKFAEAVNKNANISSNVTTEYHESDFLYQDGSVIDKSLIYSIYDDYFISYDEDSNKTAYIKYFDGTKYFYKNVFDFITEENISYKYFNEYENGFASLIYFVKNDDEYSIAMCVLNVEDYNDVKVIVQNVQTGFDEDSLFDNYSSIYLSESCCYASIHKGERVYDEKIYSYSGDLLWQHEIDFALVTSFRMNDCGFVINQEDTFYFGVFGDEFQSYSQTIQNVHSANLFGNKLIIEYAIEIENPADKTATTIGYLDYSYGIFDIETKTFSAFNLELDCITASFNFDLDGYMGVFGQKYDAQGNKTTGVYVYYDLNLTPIIRYSASDSSNKIYYLSGSNFLSGGGILTVNKSIDAEFVYEFSYEKYEYRPYEYSSITINNGTFVVYNNYNSWNIMNIKGELLLEENVYGAPQAYKNGYYIVEDITEYLILNMNDKTTTEIEIEVPHSVDFLFAGGGCYLVQNEDTSYSLLDYKNDVIYNNVSNYEFENVSSKTFLTITLSTNEQKVFYINTQISLDDNSNDEEDDVNDEENYQIDNYSGSNIELYEYERPTTYDYQSYLGENDGYFPYPKGTWSHISFKYYGMRTIKKTEKESEFEMYITAEDGYYLGTGWVSVERNGDGDTASENGYYFKWKSNYTVEDSRHMHETHKYSMYETTSRSDYYDVGHYRYYLRFTSDNHYNAEYLDECNMNAIAISMSISYSQVKFSINQTYDATGYRSYSSASYGELKDLGKPLRNGYTFTFWSKNNNSVERKDNNLYSTEFYFYPKTRGQSVTFTANWEANTYNITLKIGYEKCRDGDTDTEIMGYQTSYKLQEREVSFFRTGFTLDGCDITTPCSPNKATDILKSKSCSVSHDAGSHKCKIIIPGGCYGDIEVKAKWVSNEYNIRLNFGYNGVADANIVLYDYTNGENTYCFKNGVYCVNGEEKIGSGIGDFTTSVNQIDKDSPFYGKFDSNESDKVDYNMQSVNSSLSFDFASCCNSKTGSMTNNFYYIYQYYCKEINPADKDKYKVDTFNIQYKICAWAVLVNDKLYLLSTDTNKQSYPLKIKDDDIRKILDKDEVKYSNGGWINIYAVYEPKEYEMHFYNDTNFSGGSLENSANENSANSYELNSKNSSGPTVSIKYNDGSTSNSQNLTGSSKVFKAGDTIKLSITINNEAYKGTANPYENYYIFDKIEILNVGYKLGQDYYYGTVLLQYNIDAQSGTGSWAIGFKKRGSRTYVPANGILYSAGKEYVYSAKDVDSGTLVDNYYYFDDNQGGINGFSLSSGGEYKVEFSIHNLGYAGDDESFEINKSSVTGKGKYGMTVKTYLKSNYQNGDRITSDWEDSSNDADNQKFVDNNSLTTKENYILRSNAIPVQTETYIYYYNSQNDTSINVYYFWLNGNRYVLVKDSNSIKGADLVSGYYKLGSELYCEEVVNDYTTRYRYYRTGPGSTSVENAFVTKYALYLSTQPNDITNNNVVYYDGTYVYYKSSSYIGFNNTQVLAIAPQQTKGNLSLNPNSDTISSGKYQLDYYLSLISFGGSTYTLELTKEIGTSGSSVIYSEFNNIYNDDDNGNPIIASINYLGSAYKVLQQYEFTEGSRKYTLFFTKREIDDYVMYFVYTSVGDGLTSSITLEYTKCQEKISVSFGDVEGTNGLSGTSENATVEFYQNQYALDKKLNTSGGTWGSLNYKYLSSSNTYTNTIYPSELRVIKISPNNGYIIQNITIKINETILMLFNLNTLGLNTVSVQGDKSYYSYEESNTEGATTGKYLIKYSASSSNNFYVYDIDDEGNYYSGIYFTATSSINWGTRTAADGFESIYLLVGGIYDNVSISVTTASLIEFDFDDTESTLNYEKTERYTKNEYNNYIKGNDGKYLIKVNEIYNSDTKYYKKLTQTDYDDLSDDNKLRCIQKGSDYYLEYKSGEKTLYYYTPEHPNNLNNTTFNIAYSCTGAGNYVKSYGGKFDIKDVQFSESKYGYEYLLKESGLGFLNELKNLSIMINDGSNDIKLGSQDIFDLDSSAKFYDASFVKEYGNIYRVIFIGKSSYFKNGAQIFASGENYSSYFTNGLLYNDDGDDAKTAKTKDIKLYGYNQIASVDVKYFEFNGNEKYVLAKANDTIKSSDLVSGYYELSGNLYFTGVKYYQTTPSKTDCGFETRYAIYVGTNTPTDTSATYVYFDKTSGIVYNSISKTAFKQFADTENKVEGRTNEDKQLNTSNLVKNDKLTYLEFNSETTFKNFFADTMFGRAGYNFEFAIKYFFYVQVKKNTVSLNMNSYISNGNLGSGTGYYNTYSKNYSNKNDSEAKNVLMSGSVLVKSDSRNRLSNFALNVSNISKNGGADDSIGVFSKYMWIGDKIYQLDYVDSSYKFDDNKTGLYKDESWFNDTVLTNIDYAYNKAVSDYANVSSSTEGNWQSVKKSQLDASGNNEVISNPVIIGYKVEYTYYNIPGYYLEYIVIETVDYGLFYIPIKDDTSSSYSKSGVIKSGDDSETSTKIYYNIEYVPETNNNGQKVDGHYEIQLYKAVESGKNNDYALAGLDSLGLLSNDVTVNFFSKAYDIEITYNLNAVSDKISTTPNFDGGVSGKSATTTQTLTYDTFAVLSKTASMQGYSFVGWASNEYDEYDIEGNKKTRFDAENLTWDSSSSWIKIHDLFESGNRTSLESFGSSGYDFYIKSKDNGRNGTTGYFITDTGFSETENYNFWSAYADIFKLGMAGRTPTDLVGNVNFINNLFKISLYAIWKANVYAVELDLNDATEMNGRTSTSNTLNGSTTSEFAFRDSSGAGNTYIWNNTNGKTYELGALGYYNGIKNNLNNDDVYYCYVTFDKNDWFIVSANDVNGKLKSNYYSLYASKSLDFVGVVNEKNMLNFIIDRYGYSWLGWFSEKLADTYERNFSSSGEVVFGSSYYYGRSETTGSLKMPYLRGAGYTRATETFVDITRFEKLANGNTDNLNNTNAYSEVVYKGEKYFKDDGVNYVYHYDYKDKVGDNVEIGTLSLAKYLSEDVLNKYLGESGNYLKLKDDGTARAYYDTSLTLDCYYYVQDESGKNVLTVDSNNTVQISRIRNANGTDANYRYITLYAYWSVNNYNVVIDYRDNDNSIYEIGSSGVTNKTQIEEDYDGLEIDGTGRYYNIHSTYFDDEDYQYVLNTAIPERVGYDFVGWSFFFANPSYNTNYDTLKTGDLYKYNGVQTADTNYYLCLNSIRNTYYSSSTNSSTIYTLYNQGAKLNGNPYNYDWLEYLKQLKPDNDGSYKFDLLNENKEVYGDTEDDGNRYVYIFAMWRAQTFTINVNLNIDTEALRNGYDQDSAYMLGFYETERNADGKVVDTGKYVGLNSLFAMQKPSSNAIGNYADVYTEVVANLTFVITFDESFATAKFVDPNDTSKLYYLADLFATSAGYYLIDWLYKSNDATSILIANSLKTEFGYSGNIQNNNGGGTRTNTSDLEAKMFNYTFYQELYNSNYKNMTDKTDVAIGSKGFETDNTNILADNESTASLSRTLTNGLNASFASTNFGYVTINGKNYYIQPEFVDITDGNGGGRDGKTDSNHLYFKYDGVKYYVVYYVVNNSTKTILENDLTYLYYPDVETHKKYVIRYDSNGNAYYVPNTTYAGKVSLDIQIAVFDEETFNSYLTNSEKSGFIGSYNKYSATSNEFKLNNSTTLHMEHKSITTRQFSIYAHWEIKNDFVATYTNGNNAGNDNTANEGLAGFYASYLTRYGASEKSTAPTLTTMYKGYVGAGNYQYGYSANTIAHSYNTYDSLGFDLIPYFNGRFVSEICIEFDRFETSAINKVGGNGLVIDNVANNRDVTGITYYKVKYMLKLSFAWDNEKRMPVVNKVTLYRADTSGEYEENDDSRKIEVAFKSGDDYYNNKIIKDDEKDASNLFSFLSVLDNASFSGGNTFFTISNYYASTAKSTDSNAELNMRDDSSFNRRDVNLLKFDFSDLMSSIYVTCKFSVQTYKLEINHIFDENGDTLIQSTSDRNVYTTQFTEIKAGEQYSEEDSLVSSEAYKDTTSTGKNQTLATIPTNLVNAGTATEFNVPYGYFIYGANYTQSLIRYRPMDDYYGTGVSVSSSGTRAHSASVTYLSKNENNEFVSTSESTSFDGFSFIYSNGYYFKGQTDTLKLAGSTGDSYVEQGSPLLGSTTNFPTKSVRYSKSFYLFKGWFEIAGTSGGYQQFNIYDSVDESTYISRNITLYGYYYSSNTPTNIQFYTWNNDWSEDSPAYLPYNSSSDDYVLAASKESSPFVIESDASLTPSPDSSQYVDDLGRLIFKQNIEFGVDSVAFSNEFTSYELSNSNTSDLNLLENILKTYWYYKETYTVVSIMVDGNKYYIKFDPETMSKYEYVPLESAGTGMIVNTAQYEEFVKTGLGTYEKLADVSVSGGTGTATIAGSSALTVNYSEAFGKYYFEYDGKYYIFTADGSTKNTVITKRIMKKNAFYYEDESHNITEVKVLASVNSVTISPWNSAENKYDDGINATLEEIYTYGDSFKGADLYVSIDAGDNEKFYKMHTVASSEIQNSSKTVIKDYKPRYYVEIQGTRYYTFFHKDIGSEVYNFTSLLDENGNSFAGSFNFSILNNYYVEIDGVYYKIQYKEIEDSGSSIYYNPKVNESTVTLPYNGRNVEYYFNYGRNSKTSGLYEDYNGNATIVNDRYSNAVLFKYKIYTPISKSYTLNAVLKNGKWISSDIALTSFPSLNMDYWYNNPEYVLLGYLNVTDTDIEIMKRNESQGAVYENSTYLYVADQDKIIVATADQFANNSNIDEYTLFATIDWFNNKLVLADSGKSISLYYDEDYNTGAVGEVNGGYYFLYAGEDGLTSYHYFKKNANNVIRIKKEEGGQIYSAYSNYIDNKYTDGAYASFKDGIKSLISIKIGEYSLSNLLSAPIFVDSYQLSTIDYKSIERVVVKISSQYTLTLTKEQLTTWGVINSLPAGVIDNGDDTYTLTISVTFNYAFSLVNSKTQISSSVYAIPVFVPDVIKFDGKNDCVTYNESTVYIDYSKLNVTHYDLDSQKIYRADFLLELSAMPESADENLILERNNLLKTADYLQFVMINKTQFDSMMNTDIGCDVKLESIIMEDLAKDEASRTIKYVSQESLYNKNDDGTFNQITDTDGNLKQIEFDVSGLNGEYYIFAYYYPIDTTQNDVKHIHRVSDQYIKVTVSDGNVVNVNICDNEMTQS